MIDHLHAAKGTTEVKKVAVKRGRGAVVRAGWIHIIPISATLTITILNLYGYYIGKELVGPSGYDDQKLLLLQFLAKLHELFITASLTTVLFGTVRHNLLQPNGLPFGALFAGFQFRDISFLVSKEFWSILFAKLDKVPRRTALWTLVILCTFLSVSVGPSSAILMRPRLDYWPAGGTEFWIDIPQQDLWSTEVTASSVPSSCTVDTGDPACPHGDWQTIAQDYMSYWHDIRLDDVPLPFGISMPGHKAVRFLVATSRSEALVDPQPFTVATVPSYGLAYGVSEAARLWYVASFSLRDDPARRFWSLNDARQSVQAQQPVVQARCLQWSASSFSEDAYHKYGTSNGSVPFCDLSDFEYYLHSQHGNLPVSNNSSLGPSSYASILQTAYNSSIPNVLWVADVVQKIGPPALGVIITVPQNSQYEAQIYSCSTDARMARSAIRHVRSLGYVEGFPQDSQAEPHFDMVTLQAKGTYAANNSWPKISIDETWAGEYLDTIISIDNTTVFQDMLSVAGLWNTSHVIDQTDALYAIESLLATTLVNGISRRDYEADFAGTLKGEPHGLDFQPTDPRAQVNCTEWCSQIMPSRAGSIGYGGNAFDINATDMQNSTKFTLKAEVNGYAYTSRGNTAKFAIAVLFLHVLIAFLYIFYNLKTAMISTKWASIAELVALAVRSIPPDALENTGAGIELFENYKIRSRVVDRDGRLQLVIDGARGEYLDVIPGQEYG